MAAAYLCIVMERTRLVAWWFQRFGFHVDVVRFRSFALRRPDLCEYSIRAGEGEAASAETAFLASKATVRLLGLLRSHPRPPDKPPTRSLVRRRD